MAATTQMQTPAVSAPSKAAIPFRQSTVERTEILPSESVQMGTTTKRINRTIEGSGYVYGIALHVSADASGNSANVAFTEDGPWDVLDSVVYSDVNGELVNVRGWNLYLADVINAQYRTRNSDASTAYKATTGTGGSGGSFDFWVRVNIATNRRDLVGLVGNQDRAQKYTLRTDIAPDSSVYTTSPTTLPVVEVEKVYENYSVPLPTGPNGQPQQIFPNNFGTLHYLTSSVSETSPAPGPQNHYLRRIGNSIRWVALIFRSNGSRATAEANAPTSIRAKFGEDTVFNETYAYRRKIMFERWGIDLPAGVLVYDAMHDFGTGAGNEVGDDYYHTQSLTNAQFIVTYPTGFGSSANSLEFLTDDLQYSNPSVAQVTG